MKLRDQAVVITGGSRGLGLALGRELFEAGARVALVARDRVQLARAVDEVRALAPQRRADVLGIAADVSQLDATYAIAGQAAAALGPIDVLINNASSFGTTGPTPLQLLLDTDCEALQAALALNVVGAFRLTKALAGPMLLRGQGLIVNISSDAAVQAYERWGAYGASKAALDHLSRTWAAELAGSGVRVLAIDPGEMDTQMHAAALPEADRNTLAEPARVAEAIAALLCDEQAAPSGTRQLIALAPPGAMSTNSNVVLPTSQGRRAWENVS